MAITYGFYNSHDHDRLYSAEQFGMIFDGLIKDGVYAQYGRSFEVVPRSGMDVYVQSGRAWFDHTWTLNDSDNTTWVTLDAADIQYDRYDAIVLRVNKSTRVNSIIKKTGQAASSPQKPEMTATATIIDHPLAYILVPRSATSIVSANIQPAVGTSECPFVVNLVANPETVDSYINAFKAATQEALDEWKTAVLSTIAQEYSGGPDDMGYAASIQNLRDGLAQEITDRENAINNISGSGGAIQAHNTDNTAHSTILDPIKQDITTLTKTTVPGIQTKVDELSGYLKTEPPRFSTNNYALQWPARTWAVYDIGPNMTGTGKPDASKMGNYVLVFSRTTNTSAKYNVQIAFGTKYTMAMRCKNGSTTWGAWKYYTFK